MKRATQLGLLLAASLLALITAANGESLRIGWRDLRGADAQATNPALADREIELSGYLLPVDREGDDVYEFMLVPVPGACSHMPAPPPDQIVHVLLRKPFAAAGVYEPVSVRGTLRRRLEKTQFMMIDGVKVVETAYAISATQVRSEGAPPPISFDNPLLGRGR